MTSTTFTVGVDAAIRKRLEKLARSTGRSRSYLAAEALEDYLDPNEWQVDGIRTAMVSLDRGEGIPHEDVRQWAKSSASGRRRGPAKRSRA